MPLIAGAIVQLASIPIPLSVLRALPDILSTRTYRGTVSRLLTVLPLARCVRWGTICLIYNVWLVLKVVPVVMLINLQSALTVMTSSTSTTVLVNFVQLAADNAQLP